MLPFRLFAVACNAGQSFLGLPTWYKYLPLETITLSDNTQQCKVSITDLKDLWLIGLGVIDILLRLAAMVAVGFIIYGGFQYLTSQGEPDNTRKAKETILNALIGLAIAMVATGLVAFVGSKFKTQ